MAKVDTYKSGAEAVADKQAQVVLVAALSASSLSLRRDECGAWRINGRRGHIYTWGDNETWVLYVRSGTARGWMSHKKRLSFCRVSQNGDTEGCLRLMGLPTVEQAEAIREVLGIRKRMAKSPEAIAAERVRLARTRSAAGGGLIGEISPLDCLGVQSLMQNLSTVSEGESPSLVGTQGE
jgi:hypothetical protein